MARHPAPLAPAQGDDLARLLETEARLEQLLRTAREEAARLVTAARTDAQAREAALAAALEADARHLETAIADEQRRREAELTEATRREVERLAATSAARTDDLARYVVQRVIGVGP